MAAILIENAKSRKLFEIKFVYNESKILTKFMCTSRSKIFGSLKGEN